MPGKTVEETTRDVSEEPEEGEVLASQTGRNIIVAIGINEYKHHHPLNNPINDAQAMLALFKQCGFQELPGVPSLVANDATRAEIADLPYRLAAELEPDDNLVIFFAGHGEKIEREAPDPAQPGKTRIHRTGYLIPVDGPKNKPGEWIKLDGFLEELSGLPARHIFVILDACKSGIALADKFKTRGGEQPTAVSALHRLPSRRVMTSALHNEKAAEGGSGSGHSVFAEALIEAIQQRQADKDGDGYIKSVDLFSFVQDRVSDRAKKLFELKQTPDYGYLPGDGSGDLVLSLREGPFNRLIHAALEAMLRHDMPRLEELVIQLVAAKPDHPTTLYLQFRLKFMQGDIPAAAEIVSRLRDLDPPPGILPLANQQLAVLSVQLPFWEQVFAIPTGSPPIKVTMLTGKDDTSLHDAPLGSSPAGDAYRIEKGALAQFQVTNLSDAPVYLYYIALLPNGRLVIGPLLHPEHWDDSSLAAGGTGTGHAFRAAGLPGSVTETRIFCSAKKVWELMSPPSTASRSVSALADKRLDGVQMLPVLHHFPAEGLATPVDVAAISEAFEL